MEKGIKRNLGIDIYRIILTLMVIAIHVCGDEYYRILESGNVHNIYVLTFIGKSCSIAVPSFVMLSGMLMLDNSDNEKISKIIFKSIPKLLGLKVFSNFTLLVSLYISNVMGYYVSYTYKEALFLDNAMWFLWMLMGLYIITPILINVIRNKKNEEYLICIWFIFQYIVPIIQSFEIKVVNDSIFSMYFGVPKYMGYFLLGHYLAKYKIEIKKKIKVLLFGSCILDVMVLSFLCTISGNLNILNQWEQLLVLFNTIIIFYVFNTKVFAIKIKRGYKIIEYLGTNCMYIYASHFSILQFLNSRGIRPYCKMGGYMLGSLLEVLAIAAIGIIIAILFNGIKKMLYKQCQ